MMDLESLKILHCSYAQSLIESGNVLVVCLNFVYHARCTREGRSNLDAHL